jgi:hypothetical protein
MFRLLKKKIFLSTSTVKLFGAEIRVAEMRIASKFSPRYLLALSLLFIIAANTIDIYCKLDVQVSPW